ncbi:substrate-binding domain-containing protein [Streptomyces sp. ISL-99]|nr:substrate-binding domain-containing protein [Streptomyces sp. ISL-99]
MRPGRRGDRDSLQRSLAVYQAARELGLRIPHDLSVVGFNDVSAVTWMDPPRPRPSTAPPEEE